MHYRFPPARVFATLSGAGGAVGYFALHFDWILLAGWWPILIVAVLVVFSVCYWVWDLTAASRHANAMAKFAYVNKWQFELETGEYRRVFQSFPFGHGLRPRDINCITGSFNGRRCSTFTHEYEIGTRNDENKPNHKEQWQITAVELEYPLQTVDILPDDVLAKSAKFLGGQDIDFESSDFNAKWRVVGRNLKYAHDIVHPRMMERLLRPDADGLAIRIEGKYVLCWQWNRRSPADLARRLGVLTSVAKLIPDFVLREYEYEYKRLEEARRKREENAPDWAKTPFALTSGKYTGIGAEDYVEDDDGDKPKKAKRDDEDREW
jgi:hypothetical protein